MPRKTNTGAIAARNGLLYFRSWSTGTTPLRSWGGPSVRTAIGAASGPLAEASVGAPAYPGQRSIRDRDHWGYHSENQTKKKNEKVDTLFIIHSSE